MDMVFHIIYTLFLVSSCAKLSDIWYSSTVASTSILCCDVSDVCHLWCFFGSIPLWSLIVNLFLFLSSCRCWHQHGHGHSYELALCKNTGISVSDYLMSKWVSKWALFALLARWRYWLYWRCWHYWRYWRYWPYTTIETITEVTMITVATTSAAATAITAALIVTFAFYDLVMVVKACPPL